MLLGIPIAWRFLPLLVVAVAAGTAGWFFFYAIFALRIRRNDAFNTVTSILYFVFLFASSMFYPIDPLPAWLRAVAQVNPVTWHVDVLRFASVGLGDPTTLMWQALAFIAFATVSFTTATRLLERQE
jgi:ABC-2 type transport system permease protein